MVATIAAARIFGADAVGNLALVLIFSSLGQYLTSWGTDQNIQVTYASRSAVEVTQAAYREVRKRIHRLLYSLITLFLLYLLIPLVLTSPQAVLFGALGAAIGAISSCASPNEIRLIVTQKFLKLVELKYLSGGAAFLFGLLLAFYAELTFTVLIAALTIERVIYLFLTIVTLRFSANYSSRSESSDASPKINISILISAAAIFCYNRVDQIYIYGVLSKQDLGIYFSGLKLFEIANLVVMAAITSKLHIMADRRRDITTVVTVERGLLAFSFGLVLCIAIAAPTVLRWVFDIHPESLTYIAILAGGTLFGVIGAIKGPWVAKNNRYHFNTYFTIIGAISAIGILMIVKPITLSGVAATMAISQLVVNVLCPLILRDERAYLISLFMWRRK